MPIYLDPKNDLTFKKVFGEHKHLCISMVNSLLKFNGDNEVVEIEYDTGELIPEIPALKDSIVDIRCKAKDGRQFIVEMQLLWSNSFRTRVLLNASKAFVKQLDAGMDYKLAQPVYSLNLVNEIFETGEDMKDKFYHYYKIVNIENTNKQIKGLEFVFIELPKYKPSNQEAQDYFDSWLRFMTEINEDTKEVCEDLVKKKEVREAVQYLRESAYTKAQLLTYDRFRDAIKTQRTYIVDAFDDGKIEGIAEGELIGEARGIEKGKAEGIAEGELIGEARGIEKGKAEGMAEGELIGVALGIWQTVLLMKAQGMSVDAISKVTGWCKEELAGL
ncbi:MAG: Rpn family recombination-promoting nuclease/putative transposase [Fibromonadales bacterium]|nr:Rpn family recombination-promoting nuclease/putative transposase [Fibromonadales bacterium]